MKNGNDVIKGTTRRTHLGDEVWVVPRVVGVLVVRQVEEAVEVDRRQDRDHAEDVTDQLVSSAVLGATRSRRKA